MTKNVEWGAVAYLAHSKYGLNGDEIRINTNSSYKTANTDKAYISKYIDVYDSYSSLKFGDAVFETSSWFSDYSYFVNEDSPIFIRGCYYDTGSFAGLLCFSIINGDDNNASSFRPVCVVK